jgi:tetratricopeptide (TPR) repeat protein
MARDKRRYLLCGMIAAVTVAAFSPSLRNGFTSWDDDVYVTANPDIRGLTVRNAVKAFSSSYGYYQPLTMLTYMADYGIRGLDPAVFHATSLFLHVVNALLVFLLLYRLSGSCAAGAAAALLFAVHPLRVESVAWITERKDVLSATFFLLSLLAYWAYVSGGARRCYWLCLLTLVLSLLSKPGAMSQPFVLLLMDYLAGRRLGLRSLLHKAPFFAVAAVFAVVTFIMQRDSGAMNPYDSLMDLQKVLVPFYGILFYIGKIFLPVKLAALYPMPAPADVLMNAALALSPLVAAAAVYLCLRTRSRQLIFASLFFIITLLPVLQMVSVGPAIVADRYTYIPMIGVCFFIAVTAARIINSGLAKNAAARKVVYATLAALIVVYGVAAFQRCRVWENDLTLWDDCIGNYPSSLAYNNRGAAYGDRGAMDRAIADFDRAILFDPRQTRAYNNRGIAYLSKGMLAQALADFNTTVQLDPEHYDAYNNRGIVHDCSGEFDRALADFTRAIALKPDYAKAYVNRGMAYLRKGFYGRAVRDFDRAIELDPGNVTAAENRKRAVAGIDAGDRG